MSIGAFSVSLKHTSVICKIIEISMGGGGGGVSYPHLVFATRNTSRPAYFHMHANDWSGTDHTYGDMAGPASIASNRGTIQHCIWGNACSKFPTDCNSHTILSIYFYPW